MSSNQDIFDISKANIGENKMKRTSMNYGQLLQFKSWLRDRLEAYDARTAELDAKLLKHQERILELKNYELFVQNQNKKNNS